MILAIHEDGKLKRTIKGDVDIERHNFPENSEIEKFETKKEYNEFLKEFENSGDE